MRGREFQANTSPQFTRNLKKNRPTQHSKMPRLNVRVISAKNLDLVSEKGAYKSARTRHGGVRSLLFSERRTAAKGEATKTQRRLSASPIPIPLPLTLYFLHSPPT